MYFHFISTIMMVIALTMMAMTDNQITRMILLIPILILFYITFIIYSVEYDKKMMELWKKKEKKVVENISQELILRFLDDKFSFLKK